MASPERKEYIVYTKEEGKPIKFIHAIDYMTALKSGHFLERPPGTKAPKKPAPAPEGEVAEGVKPIVEKEESFSGEDKPPVSKTSKIHRK